MIRFRQIKSLQKFASVHANIHNHFNSQRRHVDRQTFKESRSAALAERQLLAAQIQLDLSIVLPLGGRLQLV